MFTKIQQKWSDLRYSSMFPWFVAMIIFSFIAGGLFFFDRYITSQRPPRTVNTNLNTKISLAKNFEKSANLIKVSSTPAIYDYLLQDSNKNIVFLTQDLKVTSTAGVIQSKEDFLPDSWQMINDQKVLINQNKLSFIVNLQNGSTESLPDSIYSLTRLPNDDYLFIQKKEKGITIKNSKGLDFTNPKTIATQDFAKFEPDKLEIRVINSQPFLFNYTTKSDSSELIRIYSITDKLEKVLELDNVVYKNFSETGVIFSKMENDNILDNKLLDFETGKPKISDLEFRLEISQDGVGGVVRADRCTANKNKVFCVVKRNRLASENEFLEADSVIEYNLETKKSTILFSNIDISVHSIIVLSDELYLFGQENNLIYKVINQ
jgi:hypothetical protein